MLQGSPHYSVLPIREMDVYVDFWNLMAYDYTGSWSPVSGLLANLFDSSQIPQSTPFNTLDAVTFYNESVSSLRKIMLGNDWVILGLVHLT